MPSKDFNHLEEWLLPKIKERKLSVEKFSRLVKISKASIYFWFNDVTRPDTQTMVRVCQVLGVPLEEGLRQYTPRAEGRQPGYSPGSAQPLTGTRRKARK
jgi:transcriptional regulator with XRE-family HTH domain